MTTTSGAELDVDVLHYEPRNDLAVLGVPGLADVPLPLVGDPQRDTAAATVGYPEGGSLTITPARLGRTGTVISEDSYGRGPGRAADDPVPRRRASGNSGGPVVDEAGRVLATVFATSLGDGPPSGLGVPNDVVADALAGPLDGADTGPCAA